MRKIFSSYCRVFLFTLLLLMSCRIAAAEIIGAIIIGDMPYYEEIHAQVVKNISELIAQDGVEIIIQRPGLDMMSIVNSVRKLKTLGAKVIITYGMTATLNSMKEIADIPIVFAAAYGTEELKISGKNATGVGYTVSVEEALHHLRAVSEFSTLGVLFNKTEKDSILQAREVKQAEKALGFKTELINIGQEENFSKIENCDALLVTSSCVGICQMESFTATTRQKKIPSIALIGSGQQNGALLSLSNSVEEQSNHLADIITRIYRGENPADIPIYQPKEIEFFVDRKESEALGVTLPANLVGLATRIIE
jgi:putative ABC transport system substrate-binding protein